MPGEIKELVFIKLDSNLLSICAFLFETNLNKAKNSIYGNPLPVFGVPGTHFEEK